MPNRGRSAANNALKLPIDVCSDIQAFNPVAREPTGYRAQKLFEIGERIVIGALGNH